MISGAMLFKEGRQATENEIIDHRVYIANYIEDTFKKESEHSRNILCGYLMNMENISSVDGSMDHCNLLERVKNRIKDKCTYLGMESFEALKALHAISEIHLFEHKFNQNGHLVLIKSKSVEKEFVCSSGRATKQCQNDTRVLHLLYTTNSTPQCEEDLLRRDHFKLVKFL